MGCKTVPRIPAHSYSAAFGVNICIRRSGFSIVDSTRPHPVTGACPTNMRRCGAGDFSHEICVTTSLDCPIDDILVSQKPASTFPGYKRAALGNGYSIYYTSNSTRLPVVEFALTPGGMCINMKEKYRVVEYEYHPLVKQFSYKGC